MEGLGLEEYEKELLLFEEVNNSRLRQASKDTNDLMSKREQLLVENNKKDKVRRQTYEAQLCAIQRRREEWQKTNRKISDERQKIEELRRLPKAIVFSDDDPYVTSLWVDSFSEEDPAAMGSKFDDSIA